MTDIEETLYQTKNQSRQDPLNHPIRLNNKLTSVIRPVANGDAAPTEQARAVKAQLSDAIEAELTQLKTVWQQQLPAINAEIRSLDIDILVLP